MRFPSFQISNDISKDNDIGITQYRIYVMYRNSRKVLIFMASGFAVEVICMTVGTAIITQQLGRG